MPPTPFTLRGLEEKLKLDQLEADKLLLEDAGHAVEDVTEGYPVLDNHGQRFTSSGEALYFVQNTTAADLYEDLGTVGLVYGEAIVRHAAGETHWEDDGVVEQLGDQLLDAVIALAEDRSGTLDVSKIDANRDDALILAASLGVAQNAAYRGMRNHTRGMDLKKLQRDIRKAGKMREHLNPLEGRDKWFAPLMAIGGFAVNHFTDAPNLGGNSITTGAVVGLAAESARRGLAYSQERGTSRSAKRATANARKSGRIEALINIQGGKPEALKRLAITFFKSFDDDTDRADPLEQAVRNALNNRYELLIGAVKDSEDTSADRDDSTAKKAWEVLWRNPKRLAVALVLGAASLSAGVAVSEMIGNDNPAPAGANQGGTTGVTVPEGPNATVPAETDQYCYAEDGDADSEGASEFLPAGPGDQLGSEVERDGKRYVVVPVKVTPDKGPVFSINCLRPIG